MNALIVEDDEFIAEVLAWVLDGEGIKSTTACCGEGALPVGVEMVLIDLVLPGESGLSVAARIREQHVNMPIVFVTGATDPHNVRLMLRFTNYIITKPFTNARLDDLRKAIKAIKSECN